LANPIVALYLKTKPGPPDLIWDRKDDMLKRKEFILGAAVGLTFAAAATAGGVIDWPGANAQERTAAGRLIPSAGAAGLAFAPPQGAPLSFADIFDQVSPAVVQIDVETRIERPQGLVQIPGLPPGFGFRLPEGQTPPGAEPDEDAPTSQGAGSGFFISADGFIVTNNHVVENATKITVRLSDERELEATLVGRDERTDLAVLKVEGDSFPFVSFEDRAEPRVGDWVIAVGNPFGLGGTATAGIVSAKARDIDPNGLNDFIQIDAAINRGNSGGPTFDIYGRVIGVNSAIFSPTGGSVGIGFAIPASVAKSVTDQLRRGERVQRGYLGVGIRGLTEDQAAALGLPDDFAGAAVESVVPGGPADRAGVEVGDFIVGINGEDVESSTDVTRRVAAIPPGEALRIDILREGRRQTLTTRAAARPSEEELSAEDGATNPETPGQGSRAPSGTVVEGMSLLAVTPALRDRYGLPDSVEGVVVTSVQAGSEAAQLGLQPGFVIVRADNRSVRTPADFSAAVQAVRSSNRPGLYMLVRTPNGNQTAVLELSDNG
jgi:serine protease Do